jgi:hypothetical protein
MAKMLGLSIVVLALQFSGCSQSQPPPPTATSTVEPAPNSVATFPASSRLSFGLAPGACADGKCAAVVQLLDNGKVIDTSPLDFAASASPLNRGAVEKIMGAGDPLEAAKQLPAWTAGDGEGTVVTSARPVKLSRDQTGLLVDQSGGFEHVKRRHYLFVADGNKLKRVWTGEEGAGPAWSAAIVVDAADRSGQQIVYLTGFEPGGADPDTMGAKRFGWDAAQKTLTERPLGSLYAIVAGDFVNAQAARTAKAQTCLSDYSALPGRDLGISGARIVLAAITTQKSWADAALSRTENCPAGVPRRVVEVNLAAGK